MEYAIIVAGVIGLAAGALGHRFGLKYLRAKQGGEQGDQRMVEHENRNLKQQFKHFADILNASPGPVWQRNEKLDITYANLAHRKIVEEAPEQNSKAPSLELAKQAKELAKQALKKNQPLSEKMHIVVEGQRRYFDITEVPIDEGRSLAGFGYDITALEELEKELKRYISAQGDLLESSASAMAIYGPDKRLKSYNNAFLRLWKLEEPWLDTEPTYGEILEKLREKRRLPEQANFPAFKKEQMEQFRDLIEPKEELFYLPDSTVLRVIVIPHALGGLLFAYEDITDRLALERSYNTLIAVQRATLDNLHEGIAVFGENGRLQLSNPVYARLSHLDPEYLATEPHISEIMDKTRDLYAHDGEWEDFKKDQIAHITSRQFKESRIERTDDKVIDWSAVPLPDGATLMTYIDVTDSTLVERSLRERNEALQEADRLKTEFLANVSYELRAPLTSIIGFSEVLLQNYFGDLNERQKEYVEGIYSSSQTLMTVINDILDIASIEAGYMKLEISKFDIHGMLSSVLPLIQERIRENGLELAFNCSDKIGKIDGDERRLRQVMFNLLSNAMKFTHEGGKIGFGARQADNEEILFWVQDNGVGIPLEEQKVVFDKFYKAGSSKAHKSGTGLGLTVVKNFITLHGGRVELESKPGEGTRVNFYLKQHNPELAQKASQNQPANATA